MENKLEMKYLVLKLDDKIDVKWLITELSTYKYYNDIKVIDISLMLVNAILKLKGD